MMRMPVRDTILKIGGIMQHIVRDRWAAPIIDDPIAWRRVPRPRLLLAVAMTFATACTDRPSPTGTAGAPSQLQKLNDGQTAAVSTSLPNPIAVIVLDAFDNPVSGAIVVFAAEKGVLATERAITDISGRAGTAWTMGSTPGTAHATASVNLLLVASFTATAVAAAPPCVSSGFLRVDGDTLSGELLAGDCDAGGGTAIDLYTMSVGSNPAIDIVMSSEILDTFLVLYPSPFSSRYDGIAWGAGSGSSHVSRMRLLAAPASYTVGAPGSWTRGGYRLFARSWSGDITNCEVVQIVGRVTTSQSLTTADCNTAGVFSDVLFMYRRTGDRLEATMTSTAFDAKLVLYRYDGPTDSWDVVATDDNGGGGTNAKIIDVVTEGGSDYAIVATSANGGATGAYTLALAGASALSVGNVIAAKTAVLPAASRRFGISR